MAPDTRLAIMIWKAAALPLLAYLVGSFPTGVVLSRRKYGIDVREMGSGNIGATNITRNFGWKAGVVTFLIDFIKGYLVVALTLAVCTDCPWVVTASGAAVVLGHCYSLFLKFRGGKGVATTLGCLVAALPAAGFLMATLYLVLLAATRISAVGSIVSVVLTALFVGFFYALGPLPALAYCLALIVLVRHQPNFRRWIRQFGDR